MDRKVTIDVFHDERILKSQGWLYHGMLLVPTHLTDWLIDELLARRAGYDGFIHFVELRNPAADTPQGRKTLVAKKWAQFFVEDTRYARKDPNCNNFCVGILGVNRNNLNDECFGEQADRNIFNRFFRMALHSAIQLFYGSNHHKIRVRRIFHGTSEENIGVDDPLRWHPTWRLVQDTRAKISFETPELTLISADHRQEKTWPRQSNAVQFIDVLIGAVSQCLDCTSTSRGCTEVAQIVQPVANRLTTKPRNTNSRYYGKYSLSFFPSQRLSLAELGTIERHRSKFYTARSLKIIELAQGELDLPL